MKALVYKDGKLRFQTTYSLPHLSPGYALVHPELMGFCATDREIVKGYKGFSGVIGHEFVGRVVACAEKKWMDRRVVGEINISCKSCFFCQRGEEKHCQKRKVLGILGQDGVMADVFAIPISNLHFVPQNVSDRSAVFVEPLAAALDIWEQVHIRPRDKVIILGDGKLGLLVALVLRLMGLQLHLVGRHRERWSILEKKEIAVSDGEQISPHLADIVIDCTGNSEGLTLAHKLLRPKGQLVLKSTFHEESKINLTPFVVDEIKVITSRCGPFAPALRLLQEKLVEPEALIAETFPLSRAEYGFNQSLRSLKVLLHAEDFSF